MREIDASHIRYRKRAVQRAQFLLLSDRSSQGSVTALLRRYAEDIRTPEQLFEPDDGPVAARLHLYPAAVFGAKCAPKYSIRNSSKKSSNCCWITPALPLPRRTWPCWPGRPLPPARR